MAHFYGSVRGHRGAASRLGHKSLETRAASWEGSVSVVLYQRDGADWAKVDLATWQGKGTNRTLYDGPVSGAPVEADAS